MPLLEDGNGLTFEYLPGTAAEAEFLYEEIFTHRNYLAHGVEISPTATEPVVIDVGANIGLFSLLALQCNQSARIFAIEPAQEAYGVLERNLASNECARCFAVLCKDRAGEAALHCFEDSPGESTCHPRERESQRTRCFAAANDQLAAGSSGLPPRPSVATVMRVTALTLSDFLAQQAIQHVHLLKIDVEGDELAVLRGLKSADDWRRIEQVVLEVHDINGRLDACVSLLRRHGFRVKCEQAKTCSRDGYAMIVPSSLRLHYVYATRPSPRTEATFRSTETSASASDCHQTSKKRKRR